MNHQYSYITHVHTPGQNEKDGVTVRRGDGVKCLAFTPSPGLLVPLSTHYGKKYGSIICVLRPFLSGFLSLLVFATTLAQVQVVPQNPHSSVITAIAFSPDNETLLTAGDDGYLKFWDIKTGLIKNSILTGERMNLLRFSPDGKMIAAADETNYRIDLYPLHNLSEPIRIAPDLFAGIITDLAFSPDGRFLLAASRDSTVHLIDWQQQKSALLGYGLSGISQVSVNAQLKVAALDEEGLLTLIVPDDTLLQQYTPDVYQYALTNTFQNYHLGQNLSLDGRSTEYEVYLDEQGQVTALYSIMISGLESKDRLEQDLILMWNLADLSKSKMLAGHKKQITEMQVFQQGQRLASLDIGGTLAVWDLHSGTLLFEDQLVAEESTTGLFTQKRTALSPDENYVAVSSGVEVLLYSLADRKVLWQSRKRTGEEKLYAMDLSPDGKTMGLAFENGSVLFWDMASLKPERIIETINWPDEVLNDFRFAPLEAVFAVAHDYGLSIWDLHSKQKQRDLNGHFKGAYTLAFHPSQKMLVSSGDTDIYFLDKDGKQRKDTDLIFWNYENDEPLQQLTLGEEIVKYLQFAPGAGEMLMAAGETEMLWWLGREDRKYVLKNTYKLQNGLAFFSPDFQKMFVCNWNEAEGAGELGYSRIVGTDQEPVTLKGHRQPIESFAFVEDRNWLITGDRAGMIIWWDLATDQPLLSSFEHGSAIIDIAYNPSNDLLYVAGADGRLSCWDPDSKTKLFELVFFNSSEFAFFSDNGEYAFDKNTKSPFGFQLGATGAVFPFEQFDLRYNRPDRLIQLVNPPSAVAVAYQKAYRKRLEKFGFTQEMLSDDYQVPEIDVKLANASGVTTDRELLLRVQASDDQHKLDRLNVYVNDVPVYGIKGKDLRRLKTQRYETELSITLSKGRNKIQLSVHNTGGAESLKTTDYVIYDAPEEKPDLYLITIGASDYQAEGKDLRYAAKDARDIATLYQNASNFQEVHAKVLTDQQVTKANILALRTWLEQSRVDDQVLLYVSGHGLIDDNYDFYYATHDIDFANPTEKGILYDDIEGLLDGIPARKKLLLLDACHSGEYDADAPPLTAAEQDSLARKGVSFKGFSKGEGEGGPTLGLQNSFEMMQQLFADLRRGSGATVITSSAGVQVSFEDEQWQNGAFTYAFLYGLKSMKADADQNGQVTASEIQAFVAEYVPRLTEGLQVPTFRRENLEFDFRVW